MNYSINQNLFNREEINSIINFCEVNGESFSYNISETWDCRRIYDKEFTSRIIDRILLKHKNQDFNVWFDLTNFKINDVNISLTKYYDGRWLDLHLDSTSQLTTVIVLSENFVDGRFLISSELKKLQDSQKIHLNIGDSITFDGSKVYHGVLPVTEGIRYALNIWMTNTDFKYKPIKKTTTLI